MATKASALLALIASLANRAGHATAVDHHGDLILFPRTGINLTAFAEELAKHVRVSSNVVAQAEDPFQ